MASIEDRIVQMSFDNTAFERKLSTTIQSLENLNTKISTIGARNGLSNISESVRHFNLGPMTAAIDGVSAKFLALSTIAITTLSTIVSRAVDAGLRIASAFTFTPVRQGFEEYETQIGSIQTILANTAREGTNLEEVNSALDQLNEYSDKTIYNFSQMARNIGTFTAAGVDLETSVTSIQGIANLAAISGSNSEQASTAMYQLSQALATGSVRLMDWNSVVNAGMGGEVFQRALFDTGVAMGTIADAPIGTTFDEWTEAGNVFRTSLDEGWLSAEVLTTTLGALSGEATEASLMAQGFTQEMAQEMLQLGELGIDAATKVRTVSQLLTTVKESLSSGWAQSFRIIFGDFEEATELFTNISDAIGGMVGRSADARNELLQGWSDLGGREALIEGISNAFETLFKFIEPVKDAFREIFPAQTAEGLFQLTNRFNGLMKALYPGPETVANLRRIFRGFFGALEIGWTVVKEGIGFIKDLFVSLTGAGQGNFLASFAKIGDIFSDLNKKLVGAGGIAKFFDGLEVSLAGPLEKIQEFKDKLLGFFDDLALPTGIKDFVNSIGQAFNRIGGIGGNVGDIWEPLRNALDAVGEILESAWEKIRDFFSGLGARISDVFSSDAFAGVLDTIDTGLLVGIGLLIAKFLGGGINLDFGGGLFGNISQSFEELTGVLSAMQTNLKATALLKIAAAVGILAVSLALLASIDPEMMSDALAAMAIGFGQLIGAFAILNSMAIGPRAALTMNGIATSLILLSAAILILVGAMKLMSTMSWEEIAKGLVGIAGALLLLVGAAFALSKVQGSMLRVGIGLMAVAIALGIMAGVVKLFSLMEWDEMLKGLAGLGGALVAVAIGMQLMPKGMVAKGAGLLMIGVALNFIAGAMKIFGTMSWEEMGKGLAGVAGGLIGIGAAVRLMPVTLPLIGAGLILVSVALGAIVGVMTLLGNLSWEEIGKGLVGIAGALLVISGAMALASGSIGGAVGITIMAFAIQMLMDTLQDVAAMSWDDIIKGLAGVATALAVLGVASLLLSPAIVPMLGMGAALFLIGAATALAGVGILAIAKGFELLARVGTEGVAVLIEAITDFAKALPGVLEDVAKGILELVQTILDGLPEIISQLGAILAALLDELVELIPKAGEVVRTLISELLSTARELFPDIVKTGFELLLSLLTGIRDNIGEIVTVVAEIITNFLDALTLKIPEVIDSMYNFFVAVIKGVVDKLVDVGSILVPKGLDLIKGLLKGLDDNKAKIGDFFISLPGLILGWLGDLAGWLLAKGGQLISGLYDGASNFVTETLIPWLGDLPGNIFSWVGETIGTLAVRGKNLIIGFYNAAISYINAEVIPWLKSLPGKIWTWIGDTASTLASRGKALIVGLYNAAINYMNAEVIPWLKSLPGKIWTWVGDTTSTLASRGRALIVGLYNAVINFMNEHAIPWFKSLPGKIVGWIGDTASTLVTTGRALINGFNNGIIGFVNDDLIPWFMALDDKILGWVGLMGGVLYEKGKALIQGFWDGMQAIWNSVTGWISDTFGGVGDIIGNVLGIGAPSKEMCHLGKQTITGFNNGMQTTWKTTENWLHKLDPAKPILQGPMVRMQNALAQVSDTLGNMDEFNPTITPVLDLTRVQEDAKMLAGMLPANTSYAQAARIASTALLDRESTTVADDLTGREIKFEQNIHAPKQLSTGDIYRQTRNQLAMAKEELAIP